MMLNSRWKLIKLEFSNLFSYSENNVIDFRSKLSSFRECACLLKYCKLFVSTEGGLMHASAANNNKSLIIYSPMFKPKKTLYDNVEHIWIHNNNHNCDNNYNNNNQVWSETYYLDLIKFNLD